MLAASQGTRHELREHAGVASCSRRVDRAPDSPGTVSRANPGNLAPYHSSLQAGEKECLTLCLPLFRRPKVTQLHRNPHWQSKCHNCPESICQDWQRNKDSGCVPQSA